MKEIHNPEQRTGNTAPLVPDSTQVGVLTGNTISWISGRKPTQDAMLFSSHEAQEPVGLLKDGKTQLHSCSQNYQGPVFIKTWTPAMVEAVYELAETLEAPKAPDESEPGISPEKLGQDIMRAAFEFRNARAQSCSEAYAKLESLVTTLVKHCEQLPETPPCVQTQASVPLSPSNVPTEPVLRKKDHFIDVSLDSDFVKALLKHWQPEVLLPSMLGPHRKLLKAPEFAKEASSFVTKSVEFLIGYLGADYFETAYKLRKPTYAGAPVIPPEVIESIGQNTFKHSGQLAYSQLGVRVTEEFLKYCDSFLGSVDSLYPGLINPARN